MNRGAGNDPEPEVSVVIPCLNEADTLGVCLDKARHSLTEAGIQHELIVADNGSTDASIGIAESKGARVVPVTERGYGAALMGGIGAAKGRFVIMGDADDSYDFRECPKFVERLRQGADLVQGCRLPSGGGTVLPGAMPWSHRWIGNPLFSFLARRWFGAPIHDVYCGLRGFSRATYHRLRLKSTGMEFATEMIIKSALQKIRFDEVPIVLHPDGRKAHAPHLKTVRDGWRTLRLLLMCSPNWLFILPGFLLMAAGGLGFVMALSGKPLGSISLDAHTLLFSSAFLQCGYLAVAFSFIIKSIAFKCGLRTAPPSPRFLYGWFRLERGLLAGLLLALVGLGVMFLMFWTWAKGGFGDLDYSNTMRVAIPSVTLLSLGVQTGFLSFFKDSIEMLRD